MHPTNCNILTINRIVPTACRPAFHLCSRLHLLHIYMHLVICKNISGIFPETERLSLAVKYQTFRITTSTEGLKALSQNSLEWIRSKRNDTYRVRSGR